METMDKRKCLLAQAPEPKLWSISKGFLHSQIYEAFGVANGLSQPMTGTIDL